MESLITQWGYLAVLVGTLFEGETVLVLGGFAAHQGYLRLDLVVASAFAGSLCGDQLWFWVGRRFGRRWMERHPGKVGAIDKVTALLDRWGGWFVLSFRFLYGLRSVSPVAIGLTSIPALRFAGLNLIAAAVWAAAVGTLGYVCGNAVEAILGKLEHWEHRILVAGAIILVLFALHRLVKQLLWRKLPAEKIAKIELT
jgi:membrane protein DedA with SNARE-associated domain